MNLTLEKESEKTIKSVRISSIIEEIELSPELKIYNHNNNFSNLERINTINSIHTDKEFYDYLVTRRKSISIKEYRIRILNLLKTREKVLNEIRNLNIQENIKPSKTRVNAFFFLNNFISEKKDIINRFIIQFKNKIKKIDCDFLQKKIL